MDIGEILSSLSAEDMQNLQNIAQSIMGDTQSGAVKAQAIPENNAEKNDNSSPQSTGGFDMKTVGNIAEIMSKLSSVGNDPRCQLISALKPLLSPEKRKRADEAIKIIKLLDLIPALRESDILKGVLS